MAVGDGSFVRSVLEALVDFLRLFASPTGARGSVLLMMGGLVVLGFLFIAFTFRSAIVGDLAPVANARAPLHRAALPDETAAAARAAPRVAEDFAAARRTGRKAKPTIDAVFDTLLRRGVDARVILSDATRKVVRVYRCPSCDAGAAACESERGLLAGGFESFTGQLAKVEEVACRSRGARYCEFEVRHAALVKVRR